MRRFDYSFLDKIKIPSSIVSKLMYITSLKERTSYRMDENPKIYSKLEDNAKMMSVRGSNAIEGISTTDERLSSLMERSVEPVGHDEEEIAGYRDALALIHKGHNDMTVGENTILELHRMMMYYTPYGGGTYKNSDNVIISVDSGGTRHVHFRPTSAKDTPFAMEQMVLSYIDAHQSGTEPLLLIPCFILDFLSIHPFTDGNGRMSRLLTLLLLYNSGYDVGKYISMEERIDLTRSRYYDALSESSRDWADGENDYIPFINYFLDVLFMCYLGLDRCFATVEGKKANKSNRIEAVIKNSLVPISKREIMTMLPDVSQTTVESCIHRMVTDGRIERIGANKSARYRWNDRRRK